MTVLTATELLAGPRGRGVCMAAAYRVSDPVWSALLRAASHREDAGLREELVGALRQIDASAIRGWQDRLDFVEPMDRTLSQAMYWQAPHDEDLITADPAVAAALHPVAEAILAAPASQWWQTPVEVSALRYTSKFNEHRPASPPPLTGARERLDAWRQRVIVFQRDAARNGPADHAANLTGNWWSTPAHTRLVTTTRPLTGLGGACIGSAELVWQEDTIGDRHAEIWSLTCSHAPRVWEVDGPAAWTRLVEQYPIEVTASRRHDWYRTTGRAGTWLIPDWSAVAREWDAVHVSVLGYLSTATRALALSDGNSATVLAGWHPDLTWWLNDVLVGDRCASQLWHAQPDRYEDLWWRRTAR